jgi:Tfp pilus assembly pilus retraction ATPase PilT
MKLNPLTWPPRWDEQIPSRSSARTIRQELAMSLTAVMVQTLLPKVGGGLIPAAELLMV